MKYQITYLDPKDEMKIYANRIAEKNGVETDSVLWDKGSTVSFIGDKAKVNAVRDALSLFTVAASGYLTID